MNHSHFLVRSVLSLVIFIWILLCRNEEIAYAQDKFDKLKVDEKVQVYFLDKWHPGVVVATDKNGNARVEFEFAAAKQTQDFLRAAVRRIHEEGAIAPTRTYADKTGKHSITAAMIAVTDTEVRFRKSDMTEKDVPLSSLSDSDQKLIQGLIRKGLPKKDKLPPKRDPNAHTWQLVSGKTLDGLLVDLDGKRVVIRLSDGSEETLDINQLIPRDRSYAIEQKVAGELKKSQQMENSTGKEFEKNKEDSEKAMKQETRGTSGTYDKPSPSLKVSLLSQDRWGFAPDPSPTKPSVVDQLDLPPGVGGKPVLEISRDSRRMMISFPVSKSSYYLADLGSGKLKEVRLESPVSPRALSPTGRWVVAEAGSEGEPDRWTVRETESGTVVWKNWNPYGASGEVYRMKFIDDDHLMTISMLGDLGVWNIEAKKVIWWMKIRRESMPALSPGGKLLFVHSDDKLVVLESITGKIVSQVSSNGAGVRLLSVDDTCQTLAGFGNGVARFWDLRQGSVTSEFAIAAMVQTPNVASWISPTQVAVSSTTGRIISNATDIVDLSIQGTAACVSLNSTNLGGVNGLMYSLLYGSKPQLQISRWPVNEIGEEVKKFASNLAVNLKPGSRVQIQLNAIPNVDRKKEMERLTLLLSKAGYSVVDSGADATFVANWRETVKDDASRSLDQLSDELFRPTKEILLLSGSNVLWRASRDAIGIDNENPWSGYVIPSTFRIPKNRLNSYITKQPGIWSVGELNRDYQAGFSETMKTR